MDILYPITFFLVIIISALVGYSNNFRIEKIEDEIIETKKSRGSDIDKIINDQKK